MDCLEGLRHAAFSGLVAKNAIILVDFTNQRKAEGAGTYQALIDVNHARLRPILMTTIAMIIGMLPIALAKGAGAVEEWSCMGNYWRFVKFVILNSCSCTGDVYNL